MKTFTSAANAEATASPQGNPLKDSPGDPPGRSPGRVFLLGTALSGMGYAPGDSFGESAGGDS